VRQCEKKFVSVQNAESGIRAINAIRGDKHRPVCVQTDTRAVAIAGESEELSNRAGSPGRIDLVDSTKKLGVRRRRERRVNHSNLNPLAADVGEREPIPEPIVLELAHSRIGRPGATERERAGETGVRAASLGQLIPVIKANKPGMI
jgi:hypothetical protein